MSAVYCACLHPTAMHDGWVGCRAMVVNQFGHYMSCLCGMTE